MAYEPSLERTDIVDALCMEIAELVGMLSSQAPLSTNPTLRRELRVRTIYSSSRASSRANSNSVIPSLTGTAGRDVSGRRCSCRGGVRYWPGCLSSPPSGGGRRATTRHWRVLVQAVHVRASSNSCLRRSENRFFRTRSQRAQRKWIAPVLSLSSVTTRGLPSRSSRSILAARSGAQSAWSRSSKKKASSNARAVLGRAYGVVRFPGPKVRVRPRIGAETPLLHNEPLLLRKEGVRR